MTEHDGKEKSLEGEPLCGTIELSKTHGGKLFRLGVFLLAALMLLSLPLVGSSFSKIISKGEFADSTHLTLRTAGFDIEIVDESSSYLYGDESYDEDENQYVVCIFSIENNIEVPVDYKFEFTINADIIDIGHDKFNDITFYLCENERAVEDGFKLVYDNTLEKYSVDADEAVNLTFESGTYVIVADFSGLNEGRCDIMFSESTVTITAIQKPKEKP